MLMVIVVLVVVVVVTGSHFGRAPVVLRHSSGHLICNVIVLIPVRVGIGICILQMRKQKSQNL